jgi:hypothetical protein
MVLRLKAWESRSPPGLPSTDSSRHGKQHPNHTIPDPAPLPHQHARGKRPHNKAKSHHAGWSSPVARQAHNLKVAGSNPAPATKSWRRSRGGSVRPGRSPTKPGPGARATPWSARPSTAGRKPRTGPPASRARWPRTPIVVDKDSRRVTLEEVIDEYLKRRVPKLKGDQPRYETLKWKRRPLAKRIIGHITVADIIAWPPPRLAESVGWPE